MAGEGPVELDQISIGVTASRSKERDGWPSGPRLMGGRRGQGRDCRVPSRPAAAQCDDLSLLSGHEFCPRRPSSILR